LADNEPPYFGATLPNCGVSSKIGEWTRWDTLHTSLIAVLDCYKRSWRPISGKIDVPALIIHGDSDKSMPIEISGEKSAQLVPNNQFVVYENGPHGLYMTHADRLKRICWHS